MKKRTCLLSALLAIVLMALPMVAVCADAAGEKITLNIWTFTEEVKQQADHYMEMNPDGYNLNTIVVSFDDFQPALDTALMAGGDDAPDIITPEVLFFSKYLDSDFTLPLSEIGIDVEKETAAAKTYDYTVQLGTTEDGVVKALAHQVTPGLFMYRRSLAKEYLGVETPEQMQELVKDWDTYLATAGRVREASGGKVVMNSGIMDFQFAYLNNRTVKFIDSGKLNIEQNVIDFFRFSQKMIGEGNTNNNTLRETSAWYADVKGVGDVQVLSTLGAPWLMAYHIIPNAGVEGGEGTFGDWAMCLPPVNFFHGGTWFMATTLSKHPEACGDMIRYFTLDATDKGNLWWWVTDKGDISSSAVVNQAIMPEYGLPFCAGQNTLAMQDKAAESIQHPQVTQYDGVVIGIIQDEAISYAMGEKGLQEAIDSTIQRIGEQIDCELPTIAVEE